MTDLEVMKRELECIKRNDGANCDRQCEKCDLVMEVNVLIDTYERIINMLEGEIVGNCK